jgi:hypothetical protein
VVGLKITVFCGNYISNYILFQLYRKGIADKFEIKYQTKDEIQARVNSSLFLRVDLNVEQLKIFDSMQRDENVVDKMFEKLDANLFYKLKDFSLRDFKKLFAPNRITQLVFLVDNNFLVVENKSSK